MSATPLLAIHSPEWFDNAFAITSSLGVGNDSVPPDLRALSESLCRVFNIRGVCDPMYIVNRVAAVLGMGDGKSRFTVQALPVDAADAVPAIVNFIIFSYGACVLSASTEFEGAAEERVRQVVVASLPLARGELLGRRVDATAAQPGQKKQISVVRSKFEKACALVLDHAWCQQLVVLPQVVVEYFPAGSSHWPPGVYAVQFMAEGAATLSGAPSDRANNIATYLVPLDSLNTFEAPGRPYLRQSKYQWNDVTDEFSQALANKFPDSILFSEPAFEYDSDPEGDGLSEKQARLQLICRMIESEGILATMRVLAINAPCKVDDQSAEHLVAPAP